MRKVFTDELPHKYGIGSNKDKLVIDWENSIGKKVKFIYDDIEDMFKIIDYDKKSYTISLSYNNKLFRKKVSVITSCSLGCIVGTYFRNSFKYEVNDIVNNKIIVEHTYKEHKDPKKDYPNKGYTYKCLTCGTEHFCEADRIEKVGCPVCSNKIIIRGINDIATTNPELVKYFKNIEDTYCYSLFSHIKIYFKCPKCGNEKYMAISTFSKQGLGCPKCSDGISYPEKLMYNVLQQLKVNFIYQLSKTTFNWCNDYRYDFYIPSLNYVVETDGKFHNQDNKMNGQTKEDSKSIDDCKDRLANEHNIEVIRIDCQESNLEYIKSNILHSRLAEIFDLSIIDWNLCNLNATKSLVIKIAELWNNGIKDLSILQKEIGVADNTITEYLKRSKELKLTNYSQQLSIKNGRFKGGFKARKPIKCNENGLMFSGIVECLNQSENIFNVKLSSSGISGQLHGVWKTTHHYTFNYMTKEEFKKACIETPELCFRGEIKYA